MVWVAISSPSGTDRVTMSGSVVTSSSASRIIRSGTAVMDGPPTASPRPGLVTVPTPGPAKKRVSWSARPMLTLAVTRAPSVQSGSSPASLTTTARVAPAGSTSNH